MASSDTRTYIISTRATPRANRAALLTFSPTAICMADTLRLPGGRVPRKLMTIPVIKRLSRLNIQCIYLLFKALVILQQLKLFAGGKIWNAFFVIEPADAPQDDPVTYDFLPGKKQRVPGIIYMRGLGARAV